MNRRAQIRSDLTSLVGEHGAPNRFHTSEVAVPRSTQSGYRGSVFYLADGRFVARLDGAWWVVEECG